MMTQKNYLVFDIGGTNLKYGLLNNAGQLIEKHRITTPKQGLTKFLTETKRIIEKYQDQIKGIAFSCPGKIDHSSRTVYFGGSLPFLDGLQLATELEKHFDIPVSIENDGKAAALAELWLGNLKDISNGAAIVLGTGIGGGIIINGKLVQGTHFQAGELSFMINDKTQSDLEMLAGFNTSAVMMIEAIAKELQFEDIHDGPIVFEEIKAGNPIATKIFMSFCRNIAILILNIQSVVDLERFVIGGGISAQPLVVETINQQYDQVLNELPLVKQTFTRPNIYNSKFHNDANLYGALYHLLLQLDI